MGVVFIPEIAQGGEYRIRCRLAQAAQRTHPDGVCQLFQQLDGLGGPAPFDDIVQQGQHLFGALPAGNAFAAGFILDKLHKKPCDFYHAGLLVHDHQAAGTHHGAHFGQIRIIQRKVQMFLCEAAARRAADLHRFEIGAAEAAVVVGHTAPDVTHDLPQSGAEGQLDKSGVGHVACKGKGLGPLGIGSADLGVGLRPHLKHQRHRGQRLHIVDYRRLTEQSAHRGERRLGPGHTAFTLDGGNKGGFLSADKGAGALHHMDIKIKARAEKIFAQKSRAARVLDGPPHPLDGQRIFGSYIYVAFGRTDCLGGYNHALQHTVGVPFHHTAVHKGAGVAFVPVADNVLDVIYLNAGELPLLAGGKTRAAAAAQAGF
ncbi:hypothetical protein SDC9_81366 [bioreactor metagenome]|uniref:Uncharacterized protein n=1 Tax=bioreactor metagenome TaxID=1076179 RepID=A0A644Z2K4_9ZZZZ